MKLFLFLLSAATVSSFTPIIRNTASFSGSASTTQLWDGEANGSIPSKKVIVLGGDGFCGWPTSLHLSDQGHDVVVVDNLSRRNIDTELGCDSLTPIQSPEVRFWSLICSCPVSVPCLDEKFFTVSPFYTH